MRGEGGASARRARRDAETPDRGHDGRQLDRLHAQRARATSRTFAVKALAAIAGESADQELQLAAVTALGNTGSDEAVAVLARIAKQRSDKRLRSAAVNALGQIGSDNARAALLDILEMKPKGKE